MKRKKKPTETVQSAEPDFSWVEEKGVNEEHDPFMHSLNHLSPEDIPLSYEKPQKTAAQKRSDFVSNLMLYGCIAVFAVSCIFLVDNLRQKSEGNALYNEVAAEFSEIDFSVEDFTADTEEKQGSVLNHVSVIYADSELSPLSENIQVVERKQTADIEITNRNTGSYNAQLEKLRAVLRAYKEKNPDVFGYITIPNVGIDYVMVQGTDNEFYLEHNYKGEYLVIGSIFVDYHCYADMSENFNTVLYGHNIVTGDGAMFHGVTKFLEEDVFRNELIYIYTMDGVFIYKPFSVYDTTATSGYIQTGFPSKQDFAEFCAEMKARSRFSSDIVVGEEDRIVTLSTCTNVGDGRYALHAVLIDSIR